MAPPYTASPSKILRQKKAELFGELKALNDKAIAAVTAGGPALTDEDRARVTAVKAEAEEVSRLLVETEQIAEHENQAALVAEPPTRITSTASGGVILLGDRVADDPKKGFRDHKDFLGAVMDAGFGRRMDTRLIPLRAAQGSDEQGAYGGPVGGFLIPYGVAPGILSVRPEDDPIASLVTRPPMRTPTVSFNARVDKNHTSSVSGGLTVARNPETVDATSSRMTFEQVTLTANALWGLAYATEQILQDSPESFVAIIAAGFSDEYTAKAMDERLNGSGTGEPLGALSVDNGCLISISKETGQAADTIVKENIDKMIARSWRYSRAVWIANQDTLPQLRGLVQVVGVGGAPVPYFQQEAGGGATLSGRPLFFSEFAQKLGDKGDLLLGVWSEYLEGEYQPMRSDESIHVRFAAGERAFRFYKRNDGRPWWKSALTPKYATATLSPFVTLAAR